MVGYREDGVCWKDKRQWTQAGIREILTRYKFKKKIPMRVVKHQSTFLREAVESPSFERFRTHQDIALSNLLQLNMF